MLSCMEQSGKNSELNVHIKQNEAFAAKKNIAICSLLHQFGIKMGKFISLCCFIWLCYFCNS